MIDSLERSLESAQKISPARTRGVRAFVPLCSIGALLLGAAVLLVFARYSGPEFGRKVDPVSLRDLLDLPPSQVCQLPVERLNLLCAKGLSPGNDPDLEPCEATLREWAHRVRSETERHQYRFARNPGEFENSPGFFRMLMLAVVLTEDYQVRYDLQRKAGPAESRMDDGFFGDPAAVFLHGLLGPERKGTCSSMPVLYVAVGRQLGYPLKLVTTKGHLFVRWEGASERFNIEATGHGLNRFDDDYYRRWPFQITPEEEQAEGYLKSLTPAEELAVFLSIRGMCLREQGRFPEATESFAAAVRLAPGCHSYRKMLVSLEADLSQQSLKTGARTARN
ncbi:MAG TPA: transglutaminase family protein [Verrucomicrobiae bacterium]